MFAGIVAMTAAAIGCSRTDAAITTQVKNRLAVDEATKTYQIDVTTVDKVVTLTGAVDSATAKSKALTLTRETDGVSEVIDKLEVNGATGQQLGAGMNDVSAGMPGRESEMPMHRGEMGMPSDGMTSEMSGMGAATPATPTLSATQPVAPTPSSAMPGVAGISHLYHIGSTGFFLNQPQIPVTPDQQSTLNRIREGALLERANADRRIDRAEQELWALTGADTDTAQIEGKVAEIEKIRANQRIGFIRSVGEAVQVLTAEQRTALLGMTNSKK
jgi:Spy/CpxP family protein refolding chaperone